jgi:hypothetical protein
VGELLCTSLHPQLGSDEVSGSHGSSSLLPICDEGNGLLSHSYDCTHCHVAFNFFVVGVSLQFHRSLFSSETLSLYVICLLHMNYMLVSQ